MRQTESVCALRECHHHLMAAALELSFVPWKRKGAEYLGVNERSLLNLCETIESRAQEALEAQAGAGAEGRFIAGL